MNQAYEWSDPAGMIGQQVQVNFWDAEVAAQNWRLQRRVGKVTGWAYSDGHKSGSAYVVFPGGAIRMLHIGWLRPAPKEAPNDR